VPHAVAVEVERFEDQGKTVHIDATIHVERDGQKAILIGRGGEKLKAVGTAARKRIEALVEKKVFLKLWVRVTPDWTESEQRLVELGYGKST
jgi:GTPase